MVLILNERVFLDVYLLVNNLFGTWWHLHISLFVRSYLLIVVDFILVVEVHISRRIYVSTFDKKMNQSEISVLNSVLISIWR